MENKRFRICWFVSLAWILALSFYPLYMGIKVIRDMIADGTVLKENYPKYIIPYSPIAVAVLAGLLLLPLFIKLFGRFGVFAGSSVSTAVFFWLEMLFENKVVVSSTATIEYVTESSRLADWQMYTCIVQPPIYIRDYEQLTTNMLREETPAEILIGEYNPAFKLHFYIISVVIILSFINCLYGFCRIAKTGNRKRLKPLIMQAVSAILFLGLCILACFTAFWRDGSVMISPLSAFLMALFFIVLGLTLGLFVGSFLTSKKRPVALLIPAAVASATTLVMYIGEMILLNKNLYRFGEGFFFDGLPGIVLAPVDIVVIIASGLVTLAAMLLCTAKKNAPAPVQESWEEPAEKETAETENGKTLSNGLRNKIAFYVITGTALAAVIVAVVLLMLPAPAKSEKTDAEIESGLAEEGKTAKLRPSVEEYYSLDAKEGLDVFFFQLAKGSFSFVIREHSEEMSNLELMALPSVNLEKLKDILSTYDLPDDKIYVAAWQNPLSSYLGEYWTIENGETFADFENRRAEFTANVREMILGD
ncbi:MAG: hypothetical protein K6G89_07775 [Clostridia bacterium]|nr:hypothetical protein [Clostridia bacterium]